MNYRTTLGVPDNGEYKPQIATPQSAQSAASVHAGMEPAVLEADLQVASHKLPPGSALWQRIYRLRSGSMPSPYETSEALATVAEPANSLYTARLASAWILAHSDLKGSELSAAAGTVLEALRKTYRNTTARYWAQTWVATTAMVVGFLIDVSSHTDGPTLTFILPVLALCPWAPFRSYMRDRRSRVVFLAALENLVTPDTALDAVVISAKALHDRNLEVRMMAARALRSMLAQLTPDQAGTLTASQEQTLCRVLETADDQLRLSLIPALAVIGGRESLQKLAQLGQSASTSTLRDAASQAAAVLQTRLMQHTDSRTLLRPSATSNALHSIASESIADQVAANENRTGG